MKPTETCHITRSVFKGLGLDLDTDHNGLYSKPPEFPDLTLPSEQFKVQWLGYNFARKRIVDGESPEQRAREGFAAAETKCATIEKEGLLKGLAPKDLKLLLRASHIMRDILGSSPPSDWFQYCEFTGGASTSRKRSESHPAMKWFASKPLHVTPLALPYLEKFKAENSLVDAVWDNPGAVSVTTCDFDRCYFSIVPGSILRFVDKNYVTKRPILIEPDGNMFLQKGVGTSIRRLLRKAGVNLNTQKLNQLYALIGSITGALGTIDLQAASDSVTLALLRVLLPWDWYELIYCLRSPVYWDGCEWKKMHKVSSMGNGFTFELESAVFYCLTKATMMESGTLDTRIAIHGDDIIAPVECCDRLKEVLEFSGFTINREKSFWSGPFRESCGKHYHAGADVTPFYLKEDLDLQQKYRLYNGLRNWAGGIHMDPTYSHILKLVLDSIPLRDRHQIPLEYSSDAGLYFSDVCTDNVSVISRDSIQWLRFSVLELHFEDISERYEPEVAWLYRATSKWAPSCPLGVQEYTPLSFVSPKGVVRRRTVSIPYASVNLLIA